MARTDALEERFYVASETRTLSMLDLLKLFKRQGTARVTDLHLKVGKGPCFRVDGELKITGGNPLTNEIIERMARTLLDDTQFETLRKRPVNARASLKAATASMPTTTSRPGHGIRPDTSTPSIDFIGFPNRVWQTSSGLPRA